MNLQDVFLNQARVHKIPVSVYLIGGHQMKGLIKGFDSFVILLEVSGKNNLVYKHAVSTITPSTNLPMIKADGKTEDSISGAEPINSESGDENEPLA